MAARSERIPTGSWTTHVWVAGEASRPAVMLFHGGGPGATAAANWAHVWEDLSEDFFVIAPDMLGFGESTHPDPPPRGWVAWMGARVEQMLALMDALGVKRAHLVGNSMGGYLALQLLIEAPDRFDRSILMGPAGGAFQPGPELELLRSFYQDPRPARLKQIFQAFVYDESAFDLDEIVARRYEFAVREEVRRSYEAMMGGGPVPLAPALLARIEQPILILHGRFDRIVPLEGSLWLLRHLAHAELKVYDRCGHWVQMERWETMREDIRAFFLGAAVKHPSPRPS